MQLGHKAAQLGLDAEDLRAVQEYRAALRERRRNMSMTKGEHLIVLDPDYVCLGSRHEQCN